jgi:hypothetical protein
MRQSNRRLRAVLACAAAILPIVAVAPALAAPSRVQSIAPDAPDVVALRDGVLVDRARGVTYLMNPEGRIDALRIADGALLWSSPDAAKPLLVIGDLLVAQAEPASAGELSAVTLDRGAGTLVARASVALPAGVWASVTDGPRTSFRVAAAPSGSRVALTWESRRTGANGDFQGYVPAPSEGQAPDAGPATLAARLSVARVGGSALLDPRSGVVSTVEKAAVAPLSAPGLGTFDGLAKVAGRKFLSADGRHVLASRLLDARQVVDRYRWSIYTRRGELLGETSADRSAAPFLVVGSRAVFEARPYAVREGGKTVGAPLRIRSVDLPTGLESWSQPLRQVEFAGPFPP